LAANRTLGLVDVLKATVDDVGTRANKLHDDLALTLAREGRRHEASLEEKARQSSAAAMKAEADYQQAKEAAQARFEKRKAWIGRAYQNGREQALKKIDDKVGVRRYELQKAMLQAEKDRDAGLASTTAASREFQATLATEQESLANLEREAQNLFKGYGSFRKKFLAAYANNQVDISGDEQHLLSGLRNQIAKAKVEADKLRGAFLLRLFKYPLGWLVLAACVLLVVPLKVQIGGQVISYAQAGAAAAGLFVLIMVLRFFAQRGAQSSAEALSTALASGRRLYDACQRVEQMHTQQTLEQLKTRFIETTQSADGELKRAQTAASTGRVSCRMATDERTVVLNQRHEKNCRIRRERMEKQHGQALRQLKETADLGRQSQIQVWTERQAKLRADETGMENQDRADLLRDRFFKNIGRAIISEMDFGPSDEMDPAREVFSGGAPRKRGSKCRIALRRIAETAEPGVAGSGTILTAALPRVSGAGLDPYRNRNFRQRPGGSSAK
jgi:hypothetical protein